MTNLMKTSDLHRLLTNGLLMAGDDETLPMLNGIRFEFEGGQVLAVSTDRFVLGVSRASYEGSAPESAAQDFTFLLDRADATTLLKAAKPIRSGPNRHAIREVDVSLTDLGTGPRVAFVFLTGGAPEATFSFRPAEAEFPRFRQLIAAEPTPSTDGNIGIAPHNLVKFTKVLSEDSYGALNVTVGQPTKPIIITVGTDFVGLCMPVRLAERAGWTRPAWLDGPVKTLEDEADAEAVA